MAVSGEVLAAVFAIVVTILLYLFTRTAERRLRRAELIRSYTNDFYEYRDVVELFMDIDHDRFRYDADFLGSDRELALIHLLDNFNAIAHSWKRHVISLNDLLPTTLAYAALRTWENPGVRRYLTQIQIWDENRYWPGLGFRYFEDLAIEIRFLCHRQPRSKRPDDPALSTQFRRPVAMAVLLRSPRLYRAWRLWQSTLGANPEDEGRAGEGAGATDRQKV